MFLGLRTVIYPVADLAASKKWWAGLLGIEPYFDESFFVGFNPVVMNWRWIPMRTLRPAHGSTGASGEWIPLPNVFWPPARRRSRPRRRAPGSDRRG